MLDKYRIKNLIRHHSTSQIDSNIKTRNKTNNSLSQTSIKINESYYNDRQPIYKIKSRLMSEKSKSYQTKQISFSSRQKYNQQGVQKVVQSRLKKTEQKISKSMSLPFMQYLNRESVQIKLNNINNRKFSQLAQRSSLTKKKMKLLQKDIKFKRQQNGKNQKWTSPFNDTNSFKSKFQGKCLVTKRIQNVMNNTNTAQLKVLNLDRLFRMKNGKLNNVVPIPLIKLSSVSSRHNIHKIINKKQTIHDIIEQYNSLLQMYKIRKTNSKIGIRGRQFTKSPTLQQMMGIKLNKHSKFKSQNEDEQTLPDQIFFQHNQFYQKHMKKNVHLSRRLISGIKQNKKLNLEAYLRFYSIFVNKIASVQQKISFLSYFFIPSGQEKIELDVLKLILQLMCEQLPQMNSLKVETNVLTKEEKSRIFLQALNRVLFQDLREFINETQVLINKNILESIFQRNQDAVDLLIKLLFIP